MFKIKSKERKEKKEHTRKPDELLPVDEVPHPDLDLLQLIEDVELGEVQDIVPVDIVRVTEHDEVEPATTAATASRRPIFTPYFLEVCANVLFFGIVSFQSEKVDERKKGTHVKLLGRERPASDTCRISLDDTDDLA